MEEISEQTGEQDLVLGTSGPRLWQLLGGMGGAEGEFDGVDVLGVCLEGVRAITLARSEL